MFNKESKQSNLLKVYQLAQKDIKAFYKAVIFILSLTVLFAFSSLFLVNLFTNFSLTSLILSIVFWLLTLSVLTVFSLSTDLKYLFFGIFLFSFSLFLPVFLAKFYVSLLWYLIAISFALLVLYCLNIRSEANVLISLNWPRIIRKGSIFLSWLIIILLVFYFYFVFGKENELMRNKISSGLDYLLNKSLKIPNLEGEIGNLTIDEIIKNTLQKQEGTKLLTLNKELTESLIKQTRNNLSQFLNLELKGNEKLSQVIIDFIVKKYEALSSNLRWIVYLVIFLVSFSVVELFNLILSFLLFIFSWLIKEIFVSLKIIKVENKGIEKEFLTLE